MSGKLRYEDLDKYVESLNRRKQAGEMAIELATWIVSLKWIEEGLTIADAQKVSIAAQAVLDKLEGK